MEPQYSLSVQEDPSDSSRLFMSLVVLLGPARIETYLCDASNYQDVAQKLHKGIMDAGREMAKEQAGKLFVAKGDINGIRVRGGPQPGQAGR